MYSIPNRLWQCIALFFVSFLIAYCPLFFLNLDNSIIIMHVAFLMIAFVLLGLVWVINLLKKRQFPVIRVSVPRNNMLLIVLAAIIIVCIRFGFWAFSHHETGADNSLLFILSAILIGPIVEEFMFRGVFLNGLLKRYSAWFSIISTSLFFGLLHFDFSVAQLQQDIIPQVVNFTQAFILGIILGFVFWKTGSITPSILLHSIANFISLIVLDNLSVQSTAFIYLTGVFACVLASLAVFTFVKQLQKK